MWKCQREYIRHVCVERAKHTDHNVYSCHFGSQHLFVLGTCGRAYILPQYKRELDQLYQKHQAGNSAGNDLAQNVIALYFGDAEGETTLAPVWDNTCLAIQNDLAVFTLVRASHNRTSL